MSLNKEITFNYKTKDVDVLGKSKVLRCVRIFIGLFSQDFGANGSQLRDNIKNVDFFLFIREERCRGLFG